MRRNVPLELATATADRISIQVSHVECGRCGACYSARLKVEMDVPGARTLYRFGPKYQHLSLIEALDAGACSLAFLGTSLETEESLRNSPPLPLFADELE